MVKYPCMLLTLAYITCPMILSSGDLELLDIWLKGNKLSLNAAKIKSMIICIKSGWKILNSIADKLILLMHDNELESADIISNYLVQVDDSLSWFRICYLQGVKRDGNAKGGYILSP